MVHVVVVTTLFLLTSCISAQEQVKMTILSIGHFNSETNGQYQCHLSDSDETGTTVTSFRAVHTRNDGDTNNPDPPDAEYQPRNPFPHYRVLLNANSNNDGFGVFGCEASRIGKRETRVETTRMRSDADFVPDNELFTQTVNLGDENISITMNRRSARNANAIRWRKDNSEFISSGSATYVISGPIQLSDAGTYECHNNGDRDTAKQGLNLLLVRACPANRWDPPDCIGVCDSCYNGGICDENNGKCVCAPGFMGENCLQACGGNRYGHTCEIRCSSSGGAGSCGTYLFCLVHPFGCRCNAGWRGLACTTVCQANTFGASCLQSCHCESNQCDRYTGRCTGFNNRCKAGWKGNYCQECDGNNFGTDCTQECHCAKENCNRESGLCKPGACLPEWVDLFPPFSCQTGLKNITYTKVNAGVSVPVTCQAVEGPEGDLTSLQLVLSKDSERLENDDITAGKISEDATTRNFTVANVHQRDSVHCQLRDENGKLAVLSLSVEVYVLPVLPSAPVDISVNGSSVTISWSAWDETADIGDPPLGGYIPYYKVTEENDWTPNEMVPPQTLMYTFTSLNPETTYSFSVSAVREGEGGEGPMSPELSVRTICDVPPNPENVMAEISGENQENVEVSWQLPSKGISCSSGVIKFTVYYLWGTNLTSVDVTDPPESSVVLTGLSPGVSYTLYVTLSTSGGESGKSDEIRYTVPVLPSLTNPPILQDITCNSVTMVWTRWTAGQDPGTPPITHYIPYYRMNVSMEWIGGKNVSHTNGDEEYSITFYNLTEDASYDFTVVPVREGYGGEGRVTNVVYGNTTICHVLPSLTNPPTLQDITCNSVTMVWARWTAGQDPGTPPITHYIPYYRMNVNMEWISGENVSHTSGDEEYSITFYNLTEDTAYDFTVVPVREGYGGEGRVTNVVYGNTTICHEDGGGGSSALTIAVTASLSVLVILLIIVAIVMIFRRRDKKKPLTTDYEISGATSNSYVKDINEPETVFSKNVEQTEEEDEALYANLEKPVSIKIADLEKYIRDCESSSTGKLEQQFKLLNGDRQFASHVGDKEQNKTKNRFKNMVAYDHSRVVLEMTDGDPHSDYYNANYIKNVESEVAFIASQGPNRASVVDFWRMVWKENVCNIVMLTNLIEDGKDRCIQYWPPTVGASKRFGEIKLTWESDEQFGDYNIRQLQVKLGEDIRTVTNWHFKAWPDKDVPDQPSPLIEFARRVKSYQKRAPGHLLVHCSAGVGRTGTFIALYTLMDVIETETKIDIYGYVERMRQDRIKMVQTEIQYKFLHECLLEIYLTGNTKIPVKNMESFDVQAEKENLKRQFKILAKLDKRCASPHAATLEESEKSRYPKIVPVNKRRPFLQTPGKSSYSNYINACFVTTYRKKDAFIATQSPLPNTVEDFWRLIYDWKCPLIVMLNQLDPRDQTCCKYWPENDSSQYGNMNVTLKEEHNVGIYVHRQFEVIDTFNQEPRVVHHMQLNSWNDRNQQNITILIREMEKMQQDYSMVAPAVVHCINGVGRTGVFLTVKSEMERMSAEGNVDVFHTVRQLRGSNHCMVYTEEDYYLCHQLLKLEFPESHYANI